MRRLLLTLVFLLFAVPAGLSAPVPEWSLARVAVDMEPDTTKASPLARWPSAQDLAKLRSVEGKPKGQVIQVLGHPCSVARRPDGTEVWDYPWLAACQVWIKNGLCTRTFYTAGY